MSLLAINRLFGPEMLRLDIGCKRVSLTLGKQLTTGKLPTPLQSGIPSIEAVDALRKTMIALCAPMPSKKRVVEVTLSDHLVRSWIVERLSGLASPAEIEAVADAQMRETYGDPSGNDAAWVIRLDATPFANRWPAMAVPKVLLDLLVEIADQFNCRIGKIQTRFVRRFNALRHNPFQRSKLGIFTLDTADGLTIGIRNGEQWQALRTHPPLAMLGVDLPAMLRRECKAVGLNLSDCKVHPLRWLVAGKPS